MDLQKSRIGDLHMPQMAIGSRGPPSEASASTTLGDIVFLRGV